MVKVFTFKELVKGHERYLVLRKKILWFPNDQVEVFSMSDSAQNLSRSTEVGVQNGEPLYEFLHLWSKFLPSNVSKKDFMHFLTMMWVWKVIYNSKDIWRTLDHAHMML